MAPTACGETRRGEFGPALLGLEPDHRRQRGRACGLIPAGVVDLGPDLSIRRPIPIPRQPTVSASVKVSPSGRSHRQLR